MWTTNSLFDAFRPHEPSGTNEKMMKKLVTFASNVWFLLMLPSWGRVGGVAGLSIYQTHSVFFILFSFTDQTWEGECICQSLIWEAIASILLFEGKNSIKINKQESPLSDSDRSIRCHSNHWFNDVSLSSDKFNLHDSEAEQHLPSWSLGNLPEILMVVRLSSGCRPTSPWSKWHSQCERVCMCVRCMCTSQLLTYITVKESRQFPSQALACTFFPDPIVKDARGGQIKRNY